MPSIVLYGILKATSEGLSQGACWAPVDSTLNLRRYPFHYLQYIAKVSNLDSKQSKVCAKETNLLMLVQINANGEPKNTHKKPTRTSLTLKPGGLQLQLPPGRQPVLSPVSLKTDAPTVVVTTKALLFS